jgi:hypothetical protein
MSIPMLWLAAALCALAAFALGRFLRAAGDELTLLGALRFAAGVGTLIFAGIALFSMREMMSFPVQIGVSVAIGAATTLSSFFRAERPQTWDGIAGNALVGTYAALFVFNGLHFGWQDNGHDSFIGLILLAFAVILLAASTRSLIRNWRDEDALDDEFGPQQGYIRRRSPVPIRVRAVAMMALMTAMLAALAYIEIPPLFGAAS